MKIRSLAVAMSLALALAAPTAAFAAESPQGTTVTDSQSGVAFTVQAGSGTITSVEPTSTQANNVKLEGSEKVLASFEVEGDATDVDLVFSVGTQYAGAKARVFVQHSDGTNEIIEATVASDGTVAIHVDKLSIFTIAVDPTTATGVTDEGKDTSSKSPQTGVNTTAAQAATGVAVLVAAASGAVIVARSKQN